MGASNAALWPHVLNKARAPGRIAKILAPDPRDIIDNGGPEVKAQIERAEALAKKAIDENTVLNSEIDLLKKELNKKVKTPVRRGRPKAEA